METTHLLTIASGKRRDILSVTPDRNTSNCISLANDKATYVIFCLARFYESKMTLPTHQQEQLGV